MQLRSKMFDRLIKLLLNCLLPNYHLDCLEQYNQELQQLKFLGKQHFKACFLDK